MSTRRKYAPRVHTESSMQVTSSFNTSFTSDLKSLSILSLHLPGAGCTHIPDKTPSTT